MNSRERVIAALECKKHDRVPICELLIGESVIKEICGDCTYDEFVEKYDLDIVMTTDRNHGQRKIEISEGIFKDSWGVTYKKGHEDNLIEIDFPIKSSKDLLNYSDDSASRKRTAKIGRVVFV